MFTTMGQKKEGIGFVETLTESGDAETLIEIGYSRGENGWVRGKSGNCTMQQETQKRSVRM